MVDEAGVDLKAKHDLLKKAVQYARMQASASAMGAGPSSSAAAAAPDANSPIQPHILSEWEVLSRRVLVQMAIS
jgi:hypothetical protein